MVPMAIAHTIYKLAKANYKRKRATKRLEYTVGEMCNNTGKTEPS